MDDCVYLIYTHKDYNDILQIQLKYVFEYCNFLPIAICSNDISFLKETYGSKYPISAFYEYKDSDVYGERLVTVLSQIPQSHVIFNHEVNILTNHVRKQNIELYLKLMKDFSLDQIRLYVTGIPNPIFNHEIIHPITEGYFFSVNTALWNKNSLLNIATQFRGTGFRDFENLDIQAYVSRMKNCYISSPFDILCPGESHYYCVFFPVIHLTHNGKWLDNPINTIFLNSYVDEFQLDVSKRGGFIKDSKKQIFTQRKTCIACKSEKLSDLFENNFKTSLAHSFTEEKTKQIFMPFNVQVCNECYTAQIKYVGHLDIVYQKNHIDNYGTLKTKMVDSFSEFVSFQKNIQNIVEIGSCNEALALKIKEKLVTDYYIIEPNFIGDTKNLHLINEFVEDVDLHKLPLNTVIMSHLFEHLYEPISMIEKFAKSSNIEYIYLNHPNLEYDIKNNTYLVLNSEHTFYMENSVLIAHFEKHGFFLQRRHSFENHSLFLEFKRETNNPISFYSIINRNIKEDLPLYFNRIIHIIQKLHDDMKANPGMNYYIWPASVHSITLFVCGLDTSLLKGICDNSPNKIGKYLHSYNLYCHSFQEIVSKADSNTCIIVSGAGPYIHEIITSHPHVKFININSLI